MTLFEYLSVATSIVLSLSAAQLVTSLRVVLQPTRRYWVHGLWTFFALYVHLLIWWEFWGYRGVESWNLVQFALMLLNPGVLLFCSSTLVQRESDSDVSWEMYFFSVRKPVFCAFAMLPVVSVLRRWALADFPILSLANLPELLLICLFAAGFSSGRRKLHEVLVLATWFTVLITSAQTWFRPGAVLN